MYTMGVDVGSASSKVVILEDGIRVVVEKVVQLGTGSSGPQRVLDEALEESGLRIEDMTKIVATGYGRFSFEQTDRSARSAATLKESIIWFPAQERSLISADKMLKLLSLTKEAESASSL